MTQEVKYFDELFAHEENGKVIAKSWVFENGAWGYRELNQAEINAIMELLNDKSKESTSLP